VFRRALRDVNASTVCLTHEHVMGIGSSLLVSPSQYSPSSYHALCPWKLLIVASPRSLALQRTFSCLALWTIIHLIYFKPLKPFISCSNRAAFSPSGIVPRTTTASCPTSLDLSHRDLPCVPSNVKASTWILVLLSPQHLVCVPSQPPSRSLAFLSPLLPLFLLSARRNFFT